jgi:hypothetical protein
VGIDGVGEGERIQINCYRDGNITLPDGHVFQRWIIPGKEFLIDKVKIPQSASHNIGSNNVMPADIGGQDTSTNHPEKRSTLEEDSIKSAPHTTPQDTPIKLFTQTQAGVSDENDFITKIDAGIVTITDYIGTRGDPVIPNTIHGFPVGVLKHEAFHAKKIFSIVIPDSVTKIEKRSFEGCRNLTKIVLPKGLEKFGGFGNQLYNLEYITLDKGNTNFSVDSDGVLFDSNNRLLAYPAGKKESHYTIPNTVCELGDHAFGACRKLLSVDLPESLAKIGEDVFNGAGINNIIIPNKVAIINTYAFRCCLNLTNVTIGKGVAEMGMGVFVGCPKLQKVQFEGNAPLIKENNTFQSEDSNFKVYYHINAKGFSTPIWVDSGGGKWNSSTIDN